jgi:hypothetical protein
MGASLKCLMVCCGTVRLCGSDRVHLIVGPARDERCVVLPLSCGVRLRPGYPQGYCTLPMPFARPRNRRSAWACLNDLVCLMSPPDRVPSREVQ